MASTANGSSQSGTGSSVTAAEQRNYAIARPTRNGKLSHVDRQIVRSHPQHHSRIVAVIPAYNEERTIGSIVWQVSKHVQNVIVVDDGSSDDTAEIAEAAGATVVKHEINSGYGAAINSGFCAVRDLDADIAVLIDADGQHDPDEIPTMLEPLVGNRADMVVGSRYLRGECEERVPWHRRLAHGVVTAMTNSGSGVSLSDSQCGFRGFSRRAIAGVLLSSRDMSAASEMQFLATEYGWRVEEVPVTITYDGKAKRSAVMQGVQVVNGILRSVSQARPLVFFGLPGLAVLLLGLAFGVWVVDIYRARQQLAVGYALISVLLSIGGLLSFCTGVILYSVRSLVLDLAKRERSGVLAKAMLRQRAAHNEPEVSRSHA